MSWHHYKSQSITLHYRYRTFFYRSNSFILTFKEEQQLHLDKAGWNNVDNATIYRRKYFFEHGGVKKILAATLMHLVKEGSEPEKSKRKIVTSSTNLH